MLIILVYCKQHSNKVYLTKANIIWHFDFTSRNKSGNRVFLYCSPPPHKELISPKRFTNLPLESMLSILNWMGLMHTYRSPGVPQTPKSYNALIEVFKFMWYVERNKMHFACILPFQWNHYIEWPVISDVGLNCESQGEKGRRCRK